MPGAPALDLSLKFIQDELHTLYVDDILLGFVPCKIEAASVAHWPQLDTGVFCFLGVASTAATLLAASRNRWRVRQRVY